MRDPALRSRHAPAPRHSRPRFVVVPANLPDEREGQEVFNGWGSGAALLSGLTAVGELVVVQQQLGHGIGYVLPYLVATVLQFGLARWLWVSEGTRAPLAGVVLLSVLIGSFVVATADGLAVGPHGRPEQADLVRTAVTIGQLCTLVLLLATMRGRRRRWAFNTILLGGVALWTLRLTGVLG
jgi:hypothetical protein